MAQKTRQTKRAVVARPAAERPSWWQRLSGGRQHAVCAVLLVAVAVGFFAPVLFSGKSLIAGDTTSWRAMAEGLIAYREETGREPLWAPNAFAGMPGYMISFPEKVPQIDLVPSLLRSFLWPVSHFLALLFGTYLLVVFLTRDKLAGVLAACAYGLTTYLPLLLTAGHNTKFIALCYAPWLVLAFAYALRRPSLLGGLLFAVALAVHLRADHVQITYYLAFLLGVWWLVEGVGALRSGEGKAFGTATAWLALGSVLALLMVAQPYLSNMEYKNHTIRGASEGGGEGGLDWSYAMAWSEGAGELVTLFIAGAYGGGGATYWGPKTFTAGPHYVGGVVLLLAVLALWRLRTRAVWGFGAAALLMVLFSLGENFALLNRPMFDYFPLFAAFRVPETWLNVVAFTTAVLAGLGLFYLGSPAATREGAQEKTRAVYVAAGAVLGLALLLMLAGSALFDFQRPGEREQIVAQVEAQRPDLAPQADEIARQELARRLDERSALFRSDALRTFLFLLAAAALLVAYRLGRLPAWALQGLLALLVVVDLWGVARRYLNADVLVEAQAVEDHIPTYPFDRFLIEQREQAGGPGRFRVLSLESGNPATNARPSYHHESLGGYHGAKLRLYQDYLEHILPDAATGLPNDNALDLLNTRFVVARGALPGMQPVYQDEQTGLYVLENPDALPRGFLVGETEVVASAEETWARLQSEAFDPRRTALLPAPVDMAAAPIDSSSTAAVRLVRHEPREIAWQVETDAPRLLVASEVYYPAGWKAYVDGREAPIHRANYLLRAVPVPEGTHEVVMRFEPASYRLGVWVAGVSTALVYGAVLVLLGLAWRRRQEASPAPVPSPGA